jgi:3-hydroxyacyl-CoA dehydrogenase
MYIYKVGVVGAGTMGAQIAHVVSLAGLPVVLTDVSDALAQQGVQTVRAMYQVRVTKGKMTPEQLEEKMLLVSPAADLAALKDADLIIEAAPEHLPLKQRIFQQLDSLCSPGAMLASNTSALSISALGAATKKPGRVLGLHFFNPAYAMPLVEVIPGLATEQQVIDDAVGFAESIRKAPIVVKECAGFLVNRVLMAYLNEAVLSLQDGWASHREIDQEMAAFGMPVGPFVLLDIIGLDIAADVARVLYESYGPRMTPASLLEALVKEGRLGAKAGRGFYTYQNGDAGGEDADLDRVIKTVRRDGGHRGPQWIRSRLLLAMVNEAVTALQEGVAAARDIDTAMVAGTGFPVDKEGPLHFADRLGIDHVLHELEELAHTVGTRFWPAPMLRRMVAAGFTGQIAGRGFFTY